MKHGAKLFFTGAAILAAFGLSGCGEREQVVVYEQGKYQGKPDSHSWDDDPSPSLYTTSKPARRPSA